MNLYKIIFCCLAMMIKPIYAYWLLTPINVFDATNIKQLRVIKEAISLRGKHSYTLNGILYPVERFRDDFHQQGIASWYVGSSPESRTAINEIYDPYALTAAHKTLPLPCYARVTNLENGRSIVVRINDRGPFITNRVIDLSYAAAYKLGMIKKGLARVQIDTLNHNDDIKIPKTSLLFGPVSSKLYKQIKAHFKHSIISQKQQNKGTFLQLGPFQSQAKLERTRNYLRALRTPQIKLTTLRTKNLKKTK